jgi:hypothetical protein
MRIVFIIFVTILLFSCNIFAPREAEPPEQPAEWHAFHTTLQECLDNFIFAHNFRENVWNYISILSNDFEFYFDPQDRIDFTLPDSWNRSTETAMLWNVHSQAGANGMTLELFRIDNQEDIIHARWAQIFRNYELTISLDQNITFQTYSGKMELYLEIEDGLWVISEWRDIRDNNLWTWGRMKNAFSS